MGKPKQSVVALRRAPPAAGTGLRATLERLLDKLGLAQADVAPKQASGQPDRSEPLYERSFVTEEEAREFARSAVAQGYRADVVHNAYDYTWEVEVFAAGPVR